VDVGVRRRSATQGDHHSGAILTVGANGALSGYLETTNALEIAASWGRTLYGKDYEDVSAKGAVAPRMDARHPFAQKPFRSAS
jgi:hypothetical protein